MALAYLLDPTNQYQNVAGVNNVAGWFEVFISGTPERADVYVDFAGTRAPERIGIDNDGRAVMVVDGDGVYRVEMHAPNGDLLWTQYPVWPVGQGGGGAIGVDIGSSDGSVDVQRTQVGSVVNYDLSVAADGTDLLGWGEFAGYTMDGAHMVPSYSAGTIVAGQHGIMLQGGQYYHVTVSLGASSVEQNVYDAFQVSFRGVDGEGAVSTFSTKSFHYDASTGEGQSYDVSFDVMPESDVELYAEATGLESGISVGISEVYVHRVYSGAPAIPGGVADREWVEGNYQEKLTPGTGIEIDENNVISATSTQQQADWAQSDMEAVDYIKNKPANLVQDADYVHTDNNFTDDDEAKLAGIQAGAEVNVQANWNETDSSSDAYIQNKPTIPAAQVNADWNATSGAAEILNKPTIPTATSDLTNDSGFITLGDVPAQEQADWNQPFQGSPSYIKNKPTIPSGAQLVPPATSADANKVLTVNALGAPDWARAQAPISAGNGISVTNNVVSAKVDGTSVTFNANGELEATAAPQVQSDWAEDDPVEVSFIRNKPEQTSLVAGANITIVDDAQNNTVTISASGSAQVQADWTETDSTDPSYIQNKPSIPAAQVNSDWNASSGVAQILNKPSIPVIGTITL